MAGQWLDDFHGYGNDATKLLNGAYAEASTVTLVADPDPTAGGALVAFGGGGGMLRRVLSAAQTTVGVAGRFWPINLSGETTIMTVSDVNNLVLCFVTFDASGFIKAYRNDTAGFVLLGTSPAPAMLANAWQHMEAKFVIDAAAGTIEVRREGVSLLTVGPVRTTSDRVGAVASSQNVVLFKTSTIPLAVAYYVKDFAIWDGTGARNNNFLGSRTCKRLHPVSDAAFPWGASSGVTGWNRINADAPLDDGSYIFADATPPAASLFDLEDLPINVTSVAFVMPIHRSRKTDGGDGNLQTGLKSSATTGLGANRPVTTAYTYYGDVFDSDPNGGGAWSVAAVNALQLQLNRTL